MNIRNFEKWCVPNFRTLYFQKKDYVPRVRFDQDELPRNRGYDRGPAPRQEVADAGSFSAPNARRHGRSESGPSETSIIPTGARMISFYAVNMRSLAV